MLVNVSVHACSEPPIDVADSVDGVIHSSFTVVQISHASSDRAVGIVNARSIAIPIRSGAIRNPSPWCSCLRGYVPAARARCHICITTGTCQCRSLLAVFLSLIQGPGTHFRPPSVRIYRSGENHRCRCCNNQGPQGENVRGHANDLLSSANALWKAVMEGKAAGFRNSVPGATRHPSIHVPTHGTWLSFPTCPQCGRLHPKSGAFQ
jgi:hypothetical protein